MERKKLGPRWYSFKGPKGSVGVRNLGDLWGVYFRDVEHKPTLPTPQGGDEFGVLTYKQAKAMATAFHEGKPIPYTGGENGSTE